MSTQFLMCQKTFSSMAAGGGVPGRDDGTAHATMMQAGLTIKADRLSTAKSLRAGGMITGTIAGAVIGGTIIRFLITSLKRTGEGGSAIDTGKSNRIGESIVMVPLNIRSTIARFSRNTILHQEN
jgi:hypothetical protein